MKVSYPQEESTVNNFGEHTLDLFYACGNLHIDTHRHSRTEAHTRAAVFVGKGGAEMRLYYAYWSTPVFF